MAFRFNNDATERPARQVAEETGESLAEAIYQALKERYQRLKRKRSQVSSTPN